MSEHLHIFLVEDDEDIGFLMRKSLERAGHTVTCCRMGSNALIVLGDSEFHLVILDNKLPDMSGVELLESLNAQGISTPVLMVTGYGDEELVAKVLKAGALDYVAKDTALTFLTELPKRVTEAVTRHRLQQSNRLLIEAIESAADGIMITDREGKIRHVNRSLEKLTGYDRDALIGQTPRLFKSDKHDRNFFDILWQTILSGKTWHDELVNKRKDGVLFDVSLTVSPIFNHAGQITDFVGIYRDIAERKLMQRQLVQAQKMQSVGTLAGGVAHEFNNLLAGIQGYAALGIREQDCNQSSADFFQLIVDLSERAASLTRQLLAFARKPALSRQPTMMQKLLSQTADFVRRSMSINVEVASAVPPEIGNLYALADANQLQQVLVNLAINARDALNTPYPILFRLRHALVSNELRGFPDKVPPGEFVVLEIEDRGSGMNADILNQAFDPFFTTKDVGQGTGLGLPVAFGIVHGHQGFLNISTKVGEGTCVSLYLPRIENASRSDILNDSNAVAEIPASGRLRSRRILVIDDEAVVLDVIKRSLSIAGHQVHCADSAATALEILRSDKSIELVMLDLMIPNEQGSETFAQIRRIRSDIPVLLCTGLIQAENAAEFLNEDLVSLLRKPFEMNELWNAVHKALGDPAAE